jgi:glutamate N-acetyltransferase / amino-acid N-acetyltransferase
MKRQAILSGLSEWGVRAGIHSAQCEAVVFVDNPFVGDYRFTATRFGGWRFAGLEDGMDVMTGSGGITYASGWRACGVSAGIKATAEDLAVVCSVVPATVAGMFTQNAVQAAPVRWCRALVARGTAQAIVVNSGCANACTGLDGIAANQRVAEDTAHALGLSPDMVAVCSTGTIGKKLPVEKIALAMPLVVPALSENGGAAAARAIMTTDTVPKEAGASIEVDGRTVRVGGMTKGAGMIAPNLATMLAFLTTDAAVPANDLQACLEGAVSKSFNRITIDGDTSTNDTVLLLANGCSGVCLEVGHPAWALFCAAVQGVAAELARMIVKDGEGATRFITVTVKGAEKADDALCAARAVANSLLCKTAWFGGDPNWGRVVCAVGYSGAKIDPDRMDVAFDELTALRAGQPVAAFADLESIVSRPAFEIVVDLHLGSAEETVYTCDCSYDYVRINAEYMS